MFGFGRKKKSGSEPKAVASGPSPIHLGHYSLNGKVGDPLTYDGERHLLLFGPNGSGKGTRLLVPNLLQSTGRSIVAMDPKGELTAITAAHRRTVSDVVILNPFNLLDLGSAGFNPLIGLDPDSSTFVDDAAGVGEALITIEDKDPHWSESAQGLIVALVMWEVQRARIEERAPSLANVRQLLTQPDEFKYNSDGKRRQIKGLRITAAQMCDQGGYEIESLVGRFLRENNEIAGIQSTADRQTSWIFSRPMRTDLEQNGIDFAELKKRPITVYVVLPAERMRTHKVWLRLVVVSALRSLYKPGGLRTLFMMDEFAQLGYLGPIEDAFGLVRGYGVQLWPILQDLNQLKALYKDRWETFASNAGVVQAFTPNDLTTAEWMSRRAGETTIMAGSYSRSNNQNQSGAGTSDGVSYQQAKRRLFLPQELMDLREGSGLIWPSGTSKTIPFYAPPYWEMPALSGRAGKNPYHQSG